MIPKKLIDDISDFIFIEDLLETADIIFIPGSSCPELGEKAAEIYTKDYAQYILPSGKYAISRNGFKGVKNKGDRYKGPYETEFDFLKDVLNLNGVPNQAILKENQATFTYENALFSKKSLEDLDIKISKAILCCKSYHARRALMYYQMVFPNVEFVICSVPYFCENTWITKDNWYKTKLGVQKVMGELKRCGEQFQDIFLLNTEEDDFYI